MQLEKEYPFVKHIPIAIAMSISHLRNCAGMCRENIRTQRFF